MKVIYKRELLMINGEKAHFILGKVYEPQPVEHGAAGQYYIENEQGIQHFMSEDFMALYFDRVQVGKPMTIDVAHRLVAFDMEIGSLQADLDNLRERIAQRMEEYQELKDEYGVEE